MDKVILIRPEQDLQYPYTQGRAIFLIGFSTFIYHGREADLHFDIGFQDVSIPQMRAFESAVLARLAVSESLAPPELRRLEPET